MSKPLKFGVIGSSRVLKKYFIPAVNSTQLAEIRFVGSRSFEKSEEIAKKINCHHYGSYEEVLESDVDAVYISLPNSLHEKWSMKAARAGKHILCEKSATTSYDSAKKMVNECKRNQVKILEGFAFRFHPQHQKVKELIENDELGKIFNFYGAFGFTPPLPNDIRWNKNLGGGALNDIGCYPISASRMILNKEPNWVMANFNFDEETEVDIGINVFLNFPNKVDAFIAAGFENYFQSTYKIWGSKAMISLKRAFTIARDKETSVFLHKNDDLDELKIPATDQTKLMIEKFSELIIEKNSQFGFENELLAQARVMEATRLSFKKMKPIFLDDLG